MRDEFERALDENPDDEATVMAYGDWLAEQGDPRGEFMQLQYALANHPLKNDDKVKAGLRILLLLESHGREWVGKLADHISAPVGGGQHQRILPYNLERARCGYAFHNGWLHTLDVEATPAVGRALANEPLCRRLVSLAIRKGYSRNGTVLPLLAGTPHLANIRRLALGGGVSAYYLGATGAVPVLAGMPRVESLDLRLSELETEDAADLLALPLPCLQSLELRVSGRRGIHLPIEPLVANSTLGKLENLMLIPTRAGGNLRERVQSMRDLCTCPHLSSLRALTWHCHGSGDQGMTALAQSEFVTRLEHLDLTDGDITDQGAEALAAAWRPEWKLKRLILWHNRLTDRGKEALRRCGFQVDA